MHLELTPDIFKEILCDRMTLPPRGRALPHELPVHFPLLVGRAATVPSGFFSGSPALAALPGMAATLFCRRDPGYPALAVFVRGWQ